MLVDKEIGGKIGWVACDFVGPLIFNLFEKLI